ncbi:hypothetical protein CCP3SC1AL1_130010 [Gammaproteobacteria bacterium]
MAGAIISPKTAPAARAPNTSGEYTTGPAGTAGALPSKEDTKVPPMIQSATTTPPTTPKAVLTDFQEELFGSGAVAAGVEAAATGALSALTTKGSKAKQNTAIFISILAKPCRTGKVRELI